MTEHNFSYVWIKKIFVPSQFSSFLNLYFLECPCSSRPYVRFVLIPLFVRNPFFSQLVFLPAPLWHSAANTVHVVVMRRPSRQQTLASLFLLGKPWYDQKSFFDAFYCIFTPFLNLFAPSFWLIVVICERTCVLCEVCVHVQYPKIVTLVYSTAWCTPRSCFEAFYVCLSLF